MLPEWALAELVCTVAVPVPLNFQFMPPCSNPGLGKRFAGSVALLPSGLVTTTSTDPAACDGVVAVMLVLLTTFTETAPTPPKLTVVPDRKLLPAMVTEVPPP